MSQTKMITGALLIGTAFLGSFQPAAAADKLRVAYSIWICYGPLFIAEKKGFFKEQGLDVELIPIEDTKLRFASLAAGRIDLMATSVDALPQYVKPSQSYRYVFGLDESSGADGILFSKGIKEPGNNINADLCGAPALDLTPLIKRDLGVGVPKQSIHEQFLCCDKPLLSLQSRTSE